MLVLYERIGLLAILLLFNIFLNSNCEILTPPYFNLAEGKNITASATCGVDTEGPELYCKLIGGNSDAELNGDVIQGQYCDKCDPTRPDKMHPPEFAVDGMETWWQSPPLSRGMKYNEVNLTIELGQEFHVAYVYIKMANSPRPGLWVLEKSADYGKTYTPWQYFSDSPADCETYFGKDSLQPITRDDSVICSTEYSKIVPLEGGEIPISLLNKRPSANHYFNSTVLQEWTRATNVRLRFLRTKNLLGHLMSVARQDPTVTRRYFYSIKDISIGGRCMCNGHAEACDIPDPNDHRVLLCNCVHNTCGAKCDKCCPGFEQKAWRQSKHNDPFRCEACNCFKHSYECIYDPEVDRKHLSLDIHGRYEGGGVCQNCQHNTEGINCDKCIQKYYRPYHKYQNETDACQPCQCDYFYSTGNCEEGSGRCECRVEFTPPNCDSCSFGYYDYPNCKPCECFINGTASQQCQADNGECTCLPNFAGIYCKECAPGFYNFPECKRCECDLNGAQSDSCDQETGDCTCNKNFAGKHCNECKDGYYNFPNCKYCHCDLSGTVEGVCNKTNGKCICKEGYGDENCGVCLLGFYGFPDCKPCNCSKIGAQGTTCSASGKCSCLDNFSGRTCNQCSPGYYNYPECTSCECDPKGSNGLSCDAEGKCECHENFAGQRCDACKEGYYNFPSCEDCNCHPAGVVAKFAGCGSVPAGELCQCKERVEGRICDKCKPLYWNLNPNNPNGCEECNCNISGVLGGIAVCDTESGQCACKPSVVSRSCSECSDGSYNLAEKNLFGCTDCGCDVGGSINGICNKQTGKCLCQTRVAGRTCKEPMQAHYFPTLYQYQYEVEDGFTPESSRVRYAHDENVFANYSWKGYAVFSLLQKQVIQNIHINKPSLYRMVFRFVNKNPHTVIGLISITSDNPTDAEQDLKVQFRNTSGPEFVTVSGESGNTPSPFVMNPGWWTISIKVNESVFLDYFVLLPEDFYSATILNQKVDKPCILNETDLCRIFAYPNISSYDKTFGAGGFIQNGDQTEKLTEYFQDNEHLSKLNIGGRIPLLNDVQPEVSFNVSVHKPGQYVILINYVTPLNDVQTNVVNTEVYTKYGIENGKLNLYSCPYTTMCRQVVTNLNGGVGVYQTEENYLFIKLKGENSQVGIHSVYAVPLEEWSLDYINPRPVCIRKDGKCVPSSYRNPPETKKIQFEQDVEGELGKNRPPVKVSNETSYVWLNPAENSVDLKGKVPYPGYYTFVVHYYQPDYPEFNLDAIIQNGQFYEAKLPVRHCPSESGCRSVIVQSDGNNKFSLTENFMLTLKEPDHKNIYLDYILVIPADLYNDIHLEEENYDRTGEFISTCGSNHFNIDTKKEGFCRDSVFSITAAHNSGARPCECDFQGSLSFECEKFGGQCECRPNIIGRQCKACKTGYYGFPDCKPCNCPSTAYCEPATGECICPKHVTGERCDQCEPLTYGYDPIIGCEVCNCNSLGVIYNNHQCDLLNGSCPCKPNVVGRTCNSCQAGHYSFPYCDNCECDLRGTTEEICDQISAACFCKKNVIGPTCNYCREGTFNLQADNEDGCSECFCFGKTTRCYSAQLVHISLIEMSGWHVVKINTTIKFNATELSLPIEEYSDNVGVEFTNSNINDTVAYFSAPKEYLGKKLESYGGYLNYKIFYVGGPKGYAVSAADVILKGTNTYISHFSFEQPASKQDYSGSLQLIESNFEVPSGATAKREHLMEILNNLEGIYIRATYSNDSLTTRLTNVMLDEAVPLERYQNVPQDRLLMASTVEQCQCPPNYQGLSCEDCAPGYYRISSGPHGGYCVPCQCHGHATECDVNTGICLNCAHNTRGDHCEMCEIGYHGNAIAGTPHDCLICACPLPITSNNFATACDVSSDGEKISCECKEGYFGARCQSCSPGFYGQPESQGDYCKPCQCSGNINPDDPRSCDTITGQCLHCLNNTFGEACALCAPGYFGDAITLKDCQACICDELGTDHCDSYNGKCVCKPNVIGDKCDRCELKHYGFQSGRGCKPCDCSEASDSDQCEDLTGQCKCKEGAGGRQCERCAAGYWNYTSNGCLSCGCKSEYSLGFGCNTLTGQCECLQGVIGEKCDQCPHRWAFVPEFGCHQCDTCIHALLDDTDALDELIEPHISYFDSAQSGYFTRRRLATMLDWLEKLKPKFDDVDPKQVSLSESIKELESLEQDVKNLNRKSNYSLEDSEMMKNKSIAILEKVDELVNDLYSARDGIDTALEAIDNISFELNEDAPEVETALELAKEYLNDIKRYNFTEREIEATRELRKVNELLKNVTDIKQPVDRQQQEVEYVKNNLTEFNDRLDDLFNHTQYSLNVAHEAQNIMEKSGKDLLKNKLQNIEDEVSKSQNNIQQSKDYLDETKELLETSLGKLKELVELPELLTTRNNDFNSTLENNNAELLEVDELKPQVESHANSLSQRAQELDRLVSESRFGSEDAIKAARAYKDILNAVQDAREAVESAENDTNNAIEILNHITDKSYDASEESKKSLDRAHELNWSTKQKLEPKLNKSSEKYEPLKQLHDENEVLLKDIQKKLENIQLKSLDAAYEKAAKNADTASNYVSDVGESVNNTFKKLANETEEAKTLPKDLEDMRRNMQQTEKQLNTVNEKLPPLIETLNEMPKGQEALEDVAASIQTNINKLSQQIELARDIANRIKIGVQFYPNTTLELKNPANLEDLTTSTKVSGYFKTRKLNGLLWYLGNPVGTNLRKTKTDDYMALLIQNGYPVLRLDVGNGPEKVVSSKYVSDDTWYQFIIERVGHNAKLTIREEKPNGEEDLITTEKTLQTPYTIFNLDKDKSKLFVGSFPDNYDIQKEIDYNSFEGEIEDLVIGDTPVSLWNFNNGHENNHGAIERDRLVVLQPSNGYRFNGNGYTILDGRSRNLRTRSSIHLSFKSFATEGLIFLAGEGKTFISLELRNGKVLYQYNLGGGTKVFVTSKTYNDGLWHKVRAERVGPRGQLSVDDENVIDTSPPISGNSLESVQAMFFGGYPNRHNFSDVTETKLDGCINNVTITGEIIDLRDNLKAYDVTPGCPSKFASMVSFKRNRPGYVGWDRLSISNDFKLSLKFKTKEKDGLIFYATDIQQNAGISLAITNGYLKVISQKTELMSKDIYNDSDWHVVSVIHNKDMLRVDFDDWGFKVTDNPPPLLHILYANLYVGGVPRKLKPLTGTVGSEKPFYGCIADLTVNGNVKNFANTTDRQNEILDKCTLDIVVKEEVPDVHRVPDLPPLEELPPTYNRPDLATQSPPKPELPNRGDGGIDFDLDKDNEIEGTTERFDGIIGRPPPTTPKPVMEGCAVPPPLSPEDNSEGLRFGTQANSRLEYKTARGKYRKNFDFSIQIKTNSTEGLIFYISNKKMNEHTQYIALYLDNGFVVFKLKDERNEAVEIKSTTPCNNGKWCDISFSHENSHGKLVVNNDVYSRDSGISAFKLELPFYIGGIPPEYREDVSYHLKTSIGEFVGCIRHFQMNNKPMEQPAKYGVIPCSKNVEVGTYFGGNIAYMKLRNKFKVGLLFNIKLEIKPHVDTGLIIAAFGKKDFLILEMVNGTMKFTVENGKGPVTTSYKPPNRYYFCDGNWHKIQAVKSNNVITLAVDNVFTDPKIGDRSGKSTDTGSALLLGGHKMIRKLRGSISKSPYVGCVKNISVNSETIELLPEMADGNVTIGFCRTN